MVSNVLILLATKLTHLLLILIDDLGKLLGHELVYLLDLALPDIVFLLMCGCDYVHVQVLVIATFVLDH